MALKNIDWFEVFLFGCLAICIAIVVIAVGVALINPSGVKRYCESKSNVSQECINYRMQNCLETELYSRAECIILTSGE